MATKKTKTIDVPQTTGPMRLFTKIAHEWRPLPESWGWADSAVEIRPFTASERALFEQIERKHITDHTHRSMIEHGFSTADIFADEDATPEEKKRCELNWRKVEVSKRIDAGAVLRKDEEQYKLIAGCVRSIRLGGQESPFTVELLRQAESVFVEWIVGEVYNGSSLSVFEADSF